MLVDSDFTWLRDRLVSESPHRNIPPLPPKGGPTGKQTEERSLNARLNFLIHLSADCLSFDFSLFVILTFVHILSVPLSRLAIDSIKRALVVYYVSGESKIAESSISSFLTQLQH